jgi:uncharacterized protein (TIGR02145 family)
MKRILKLKFWVMLLPVLICGCNDHRKNLEDKFENKSDGTYLSLNNKLFENIGKKSGNRWEYLQPDGRVRIIVEFFEDKKFSIKSFIFNEETKKFNMNLEEMGNWKAISLYNVEGSLLNNKTIIRWYFSKDYSFLKDDKGVEFGNLKLIGDLADNSNDEKKYPEIKIGDQIWMSKNLNVKYFTNGDIIPTAESQEAWDKASMNKQPACCCYNNKEINCLKYGRLYNYYAVIDSRGLAPNGWHVSKESEWNELISQIDANSYIYSRGAQNKMGYKLKSKDGWKWESNGTNESGFNAYPSGFRGTVIKVGFNYLGERAFFHVYKPTSLSDWTRSYSLSNLNGIYVEIENFGNGMSVRCVKNI